MSEVNDLKAKIFDLIAKRDKLSRVYKALGEEEIKLRKELKQYEDQGAKSDS